MVHPRISVITVVFNDVHNLEKTLLSVLRQTFRDFEYIVIDGGSNDGTVDIIKKYSKELAYWVSEKDGGMFEAMNKGVARASGEWVMILNSGDYLISDTIFEEIFSIDLPRQGDILYGGFIGNFNGQPVKCLPPTDVYIKAWQGMQVCHSSMLVKNDVAKKITYDTKYRHSADGDFFARLICSGCRFTHLNKYIFRVGTLGNSFEHWLACRLENWQIARTHFPGIKTDLFHCYGLVKECLFRLLKKVTSAIGLYQGMRYVYRKKLRHKFTLLPKNVEPYQDPVCR